jgi:hypothetical protein
MILDKVWALEDPWLVVWRGATSATRGVRVASARTNKTSQMKELDKQSITTNLSLLG